VVITGMRWKGKTAFLGKEPGMPKRR